jgi:hypothetical protein
MRRRAIAGSSRRAACRGGRGCCGRLLLIVLLPMRRLRCHGGHGVQWQSRRRVRWVVWLRQRSALGRQKVSISGPLAVLGDRMGGRGEESLSSSRRHQTLHAASCARATRKRLRSGEDVEREQLDAQRLSVVGARNGAGTAMAVGVATGVGCCSGSAFTCTVSERAGSGSGRWLRGASLWWCCNKSSATGYLTVAANKRWRV